MYTPFGKRKISKKKICSNLSRILKVEKLFINSKDAKTSTFKISTLTESQNHQDVIFTTKIQLIHYNAKSCFNLSK